MKQDSPELLQTDTLYNFRSPDPLKAPVKVNNVTIEMEIDTGAAASVISKRTYKNAWVREARPSLLTTDVLLRTYSGERLNIRGEIKVDVQFRDKQARLNLLVVHGLVLMAASNHSVLFKEELGQIKGVKVKIYVDPKARAIVFQPRPVPYALRARVEEELKRLKATGIIEPVTHSDWAAPVVPVVKRRWALVYLDDILVAGSSEEEHMQLLEIVLAKLENAGIRLKRSKCLFMLPSIQYLDHHISAERISPAEGKKRAVLDAPVPQNIPQLRSFLGLVNYYGKFLHKLADTLDPLHQLLRKHEPWHWGQQQERAFDKTKSQLTSTCILTHFNPEKRLVLSCDASPNGLGAVLAHLFEDGSERPIAFASHSLAPAEKKYSQIEKEGLAIISARELSRLPVEEAPKEVFLHGEMMLTLGALSDEDRPVTVTSIRAWIATDPILAWVKLSIGPWWLARRHQPLWASWHHKNEGPGQRSGLVTRDGLRVGVKVTEVVPVVSTSSQQTIRELRQSDKSIEAKSIKSKPRSDRGQAGPLSDSVHLDTGVEVKRHVDHVRLQGPGQPVEMEETEGSNLEGKGTVLTLYFQPPSRQGNPAPETPTEQEIVDEGAEETPVVQEENVAPCRASSSR
eukprot:Em0002g324a